MQVIEPVPITCAVEEQGHRKLETETQRDDCLIELKNSIARLTDKIQQITIGNHDMSSQVRPAAQCFRC